MGTNVMKGVKILVSLLGIGVSIASSYLGDKELDAKIAKKVAEEIAKKEA